MFYILYFIFLKIALNISLQVGIMGDRQDCIAQDIILHFCKITCDLQPNCTFLLK